jgi:hypothetical protein
LIQPSVERKTTFEFNFECGGDVCGHHAERLLRRAHVDGLPVPVQDQDDGLIQYVRHKNISYRSRHEEAQIHIQIPKVQSFESLLTSAATIIEVFVLVEIVNPPPGAFSRMRCRRSKASTLSALLVMI